ncbi:MAG: chemotaxis protein [Rhizobiales bacterium]|nr:chemotaxis protein [Hyphomicrobiales bacterium]
MNHSFGLVIEALVAVLLVVTIGYCMLLNKRLLRLKADEQSLKATIGELITATEIAERAIGGLKHTVRDVNENLGEQIAAATDLSERLIRQLAEGDAVLGRLSRIAVAARTPAAPAPAPVPVQQAPEAPRLSAAKAAMAATQAFAERRRANGIAA